MFQVLFVGVAILIPLALYAAHLIQKTKVEKARRIADLTFRYKLANSIVAGVPPQFMNKELTVFLLQETIKTLSYLQRETPKDSRVRLSLENKVQHLQEIQQSYTKPKSMPLINLQDARLIRGKLMSLRGMVEAQVNKNLLDPKVGKNFQQFINWQSVRCVSDFLIERARRLHKAKNYRLSLHTFNNALKELQRLPNNKMAVNAATNCKATIEEVEEEFKLYMDELSAQREKELAEKKKNGGQDLKEVWEEQFGGTLAS